MSLPDNIGKPSSILTDEDIKRAIGSGYLIQKAYFDEKNIKYASYELTVGEEIDDILGVKETGTTQLNLKQIDAETIVEIWPRQTVRVYTHEWLSIPENVLGRVTVLGQIFGSGLSASNTYVDPGYSGRLYITLHNVSPRVVELKYRHPLARIEFHKLGKSVKTAHNSKPRSDLFLLGKNEVEHLINIANPSFTDLEDHIINSKPGTACFKHLKVLEDLISRTSQIEQNNNYLKLGMLIVAATLLFILTIVLYDKLPKIITDKLKQEVVGIISLIATLLISSLNKNIRNTGLNIIRNFQLKDSR